MMQERAALEQLDRVALVALVLAQQARVAALEARVAVLTARVDELGGSPPAPPAASPLPPFVKPARQAKPTKGARKRRGQAFGRRRMTPTRVVEHAVAACPECGTGLCGGTVVRRRQVLHIPQAPVEVVEHVARRRVCPRCGRAHTPPLDLGEAFGRQRLSLDTLACIASLRAVGRLPLRAIRWLLAALHGLRLSLGGLVSDFYAAYNTYIGPHQRCWAHLLRDVHGLRVAHPDDGDVATWAAALHALYQEAKRQAATAQPGAARLAALGQPFWAADCAANWRSPAAASTCSSTSCLPSSPTRRCRPTTTWPSAASARWSSPARSAAAPVPPRARAPGWPSPRSSPPGWPRAATPSSPVANCSSPRHSELLLY